MRRNSGGTSLNRLAIRISRLALTRLPWTRGIWPLSPKAFAVTCKRLSKATLAGDSALRRKRLFSALGAKRQQLQAKLGIELAILGLWAGLLAVLLTEIMTAVITLTLLEGNVQLHAYLWLTPLLSAALVMMVGLFNLRRVWQVSPMLVLRED